MAHEEAVGAQHTAFFRELVQGSIGTGVLPRKKTEVLSIYVVK